MKKQSRAAMMRGQINLLDEIIVDNFAGGGGASTGMELATGRPVAIAINHDPDAILMHKTNHPYTEHFQASVWDVDPVKVCAGRPVGLAWFSPDCKHFSKAKGAALVDRNIRGLAWIVLRWAALVRPRVIILENVEEFQTWGPVRKGKPVKKKAGMTFRQWKSQLADLGYAIEHRELVAADYGAPTIRKRFFLIARCDGRPIVWPERTHAPADSEEVRSGKCKPWRSAAEIIDWSLPMYSVFATKEEIKREFGVNAVRPLADNTMRRVIRGVDKFTIKSGKPFLVPTGYGERPGQAPRVNDLGQPLSTVVSTVKQNLCRPEIAPYLSDNTVRRLVRGVEKFVNDERRTEIAPFLAECNHSGEGHLAGVTEPLGTITAKCTKGVCAAQLIQYHTEQSEDVRGQGLRDPLQTVDASNRYGLVSANLVEYFGTGHPIDLTEPLHTATSHDREALTAAHICKYFGDVVGADAGEPLPTVTSVDHNAIAAAHVVKFKGTNLGQAATEPLQTVTAHANSFGICKAVIAKAEPGRDLGNWPKIRALLNKYCGYNLAEDEIILLIIGGVAYYIRDILLRMLTPRELYNAMGFPPDYIIDRDYLGNEYGKTKQVARCGNAVPPPFATALVRANLPEWCDKRITTMAELERAVAV